MGGEREGELTAEDFLHRHVLLWKKMFFEQPGMEEGGLKEDRKSSIDQKDKSS